ncbi:MAG: hypothetical protein CR991_08165 [Proteobacteria bacterium]|nr:MAG: hypothetical protein CR991_08165 [Pseudomonadota bacterium]
MVASAAYLAAYGVPENLTDLAQHILLIRSEQLTMSWNQLLAEAQLVLPSTWQNQVLGNSFALEQGAKAGLGLALLVDFVVVGAVQRGELQTVLQAWTAPLHTDFYLSYVPAPQWQVVHKLLLKALQTVLQVQFSTAFVMN